MGPPSSSSVTRNAASARPATSTASTAMITHITRLPDCSPSSVGAGPPSGTSMARSRATSAAHDASRSSIGLRRASAARSAGSSSGCGMIAPPISTGITGPGRRRAVPSSIRTVSVARSRRRRPCSSRSVSQSGPIIASTTSARSMICSIASTMSVPGTTDSMPGTTVMPPPGSPSSWASRCAWALPSGRRWLMNTLVMTPHEYRSTQCGLQRVAAPESTGSPLAGEARLGGRLCATGRHTHITVTASQVRRPTLTNTRAGCRIRTDDIFFTREVLYQLS